MEDNKNLNTPNTDENKGAEGNTDENNGTGADTGGNNVTNTNNTANNTANTNSNNPYQSIIEQQQEQIQALIDANNSLTQQVTSFVKNGAQLNDNNGMGATLNNSYENQVEAQIEPLYDGDDLSLEALAKEIGERSDYA